MAKLMYSQKWYSINEYALDYFEFIYRYYATCARSLPITYYNLDLPNSVYDGKLLQGGSYEPMGNLSGLLWKKIMTVQAFSFEPMVFTQTADEEGVAFRDRMSSLWLPTIYELRPYVHDYVIYEQPRQRDDQFQDQIPMYEVVNVEKASSTELTFWKVSLKSTHYKKTEIENQLSGNYTFYDFEKHIYKTSDAIFLTKLQLKNDKLKVNDFYKENIGLYCENVIT
jgi:hypothetical protein